MRLVSIHHVLYKMHIKTITDNKLTIIHLHLKFMYDMYLK